MVPTISVANPDIVRPLVMALLYNVPEHRQATIRNALTDLIKSVASLAIAPLQGMDLSLLALDKIFICKAVSKETALHFYA
jgi:hypothetical protein